jgi:hypothetical protein
MAGVQAGSCGCDQELMRLQSSLGEPADMLNRYFELADGAWARAQAHGSVDRWYAIADLTVQLQFAGSALLQVIAPALAHLEVERLSEEPVLTVRLWDRASTGVAMPPAPVAIDDFTVRGELNGFGDDQHRLAYDRQGRTLSLFDRRNRLGWFCAYDAGTVPTYERGAPLRWILGWLMRNHGRQVVHAAGVGTDEGSVLIVGRGGAGKSNTSVGCMLSGLSFVGDDFCAVATIPRPMIYSLYSSAKLRSGDWARLPLPRINREDPDTEKNLYYLHPHYAGQLKDHIPLLAILLPSRSDARMPRFERISPRIPLIEMASQSISMLPNAGGEAVTMLSSLVRRLPCYRFHLGSEPALIPAAASDFIRRVAATDKDSD